MTYTVQPRRLIRHRLAQAELGTLGWLSIAVLVAWTVLAVLAPILAPFDESAIVTREAFQPAGGGLLLGADYLGRDLFSRILYGARTTLGLALVATVLGCAAGILLGFTAALSGSWVDAAISRVNDAFVSIPQIMLALVVVSSLGSSLAVLVLTVAFIEATRIYRVSRAVAQNIAVVDFIEVSRARGEGMGWIMRHEILPNAAAPLLTESGLRFTYSILLLSALSFLGLGVQPPAADWGAMVRENRLGISFGAAAAIYPAICILSVTLAINFLVDWSVARGKKAIPSELLS